MESKGRAIALVDDDSGMRKAVEQLLGAAGFEVTAFTSAEEFLASSMSPPACLILDVHLPGLSGFELYEKVRSPTGERPVIFITAHDEPAARGRAERLGAAAYLAKPFTGRRLLEALSKVTTLDTPRRERE